MVDFNFRQNFTHSCLVVCFLILLKMQKGIKFDENTEEEIYLKGTRRHYSVYIVGIIVEIINKFNIKINITVDNKYFTSILKKEFTANDSVGVCFERVAVSLIKEMVGIKPVTVQIDNNLLGDYSHSSHFVVLTKNTGRYFRYLDPMSGQEGLISHKKLGQAVRSLKKHIKMCPLLFTLT